MAMCLTSLPQLSWLEREAVNLKVAGSSPAGSAVSQACLPTEWGLFATWTRQAAITSVRRCHAKDDDANEWEWSYDMTLAGLEPAIFASEEQRLIHQATGPMALDVLMTCVQRILELVPNEPVSAKSCCIALVERLVIIFLASLEQETALQLPWHLKEGK